MSKSLCRLVHKVGKFYNRRQAGPNGYAFRTQCWVIYTPVFGQAVCKAIHRGTSQQAGLFVLPSSH